MAKTSILYSKNLKVITMKKTIACTLLVMLPFIGAAQIKTALKSKDSMLQTAEQSTTEPENITIKGTLKAGSIISTGATKKSGVLLQNTKGKTYSIASRTDGQNNTSLFAIADETAPGETMRLVISADGNVGIGTTVPDEKLTVKGAVHSEEVRVDLLVPADYVFEKYYTGASALKKEYTMPTLDEVAAFTEANHHLPDMPSAKTMQQDGVKLGEMTNLLLQKTEELTLYMIEQQEQIKLLQEQNQLLQEQLQALKDKSN
jgi:hypothetical protein